MALEDFLILMLKQLARMRMSMEINIQNLPERFFPESKIIQKYFSSDVLKSVIVVISIIVLNFLLRDAMHLAEV